MDRHTIRNAVARLRRTSSASRRTALRTAGAWLAVGLPVALCVSLIVSTGGEVQTCLLSLVGGKADSVYGSTYSEAIAIFPSLGQWLSGAVDWQCLCVAALTTLGAAAGTTPRQQITLFTAMCFASLTAFDLLGLIHTGALAWDAVLTNVAADLVGAAAIALFVLSILCGRERVAAAYGRIAAGATTVVAGAAVSAAIYVAMLYLYDPLPVRVKFAAAHPLSGVVMTNAAGALGKPDPAPRRFDLLPSDLNGGTGEVNSPAGHMRVHWRATDAATRFAATFILYADCIGGRRIETLPNGRIALKREGVRSIDVAFDPGGTWLDIAANPNNRFSFTDGGPAMFSTSVADSKAKVTYFTTGHGSFHNSGPDRQTFYLSAFLIKTSGRTTRMVPRSLSVSVDGAPLRIYFPGAEHFDAGARVKCRALDPPPIGVGGSIPSSVRVRPGAGNAAVGIAVMIAPLARAPSATYTPDASILNVSGADGWVSVGGLKASDLQERALGSTDFVMVERGLERLEIDGAKIDVRRDQQIVTLGDLRGAYEEDGAFSVSGNARTAWLDGRRLNPTKWERLPVPIQIFLLTTLVATLVGTIRLAKPVVARLSREDRLLSP